MTLRATAEGYSDPGGLSDDIAGKGIGLLEARGEVVHMRVDRGRLNWGIFFIVLGLVPLAYYRGATGLGEAWRLWPLILVGIGLAFVLSRTRAFFLGGTVVAVCLGLVFGSVLTVHPSFGCGDGGHDNRTISQSGSFDGDTSVELNLACGSASISTSSDAQWHVDASNSGGSTPSVNSNSRWLRVSSSSPDHWTFDRGRDDWQVKLPAGNQINLNATLDLGDARFNLASANLASARFSLNLGSLHVDLTGAKVGSLHLSTNLGSAYLTLDPSSDLAGDLSTNLGSLEVCIPEGLGVQVTASDSLSSSDFAKAGMVRAGGAWRTTNYDTAAHKAILTASTSLGSIKFGSAGGCR